MTISKQNMQYLFYKACKKGMLKLVNKCIQHGADPTANNNYAIKWASHKGHVEVVKILENWIKNDIKKHKKQTA